MGGVIGATSGKFILMAATLLMQGRVDGKHIRVAIAPGVARSAVIPAFGSDGERRIGLGAESFRVRIGAVEPIAGADLRIGQDVLNAYPIAIDFARRHVQPLSDSEARRFERSSIAIPVVRSADGSMTIDATVDGAAPVRVSLDLGTTIGVAMPGLGAHARISLGPVALPGAETGDGPQPVVGLYAFRRLRILFDLGHDRIWIRR